MTLAREFPHRETGDILAEFFAHRPYARELRDAELALQWLYREQAGELQNCPPREAIEIRRDIRKTRIRLRGLRRRAA